MGSDSVSLQTNLCLNVISAKSSNFDLTQVKILLSERFGRLVTLSPDMNNKHFKALNKVKLTTVKIGQEKW